MRARLTKVGAAVAALAALAVGGSALASAGSNPKPAAPPAASQNQPGAAEQPGVEQEDGTAKADTDTIQDENGKDDATEQSESAEQESGSEVPGDDGPGGWADEPGNPNANTQQQGEH